MIDLTRYPEEWCAAWNSHDLDRLLERFDDNIVFKSPAAVRIVPASGGVIRGKRALRDYWGEGLRMLPDLHFEVLGVYQGVDCLGINFLDQNDKVATEVLVFSSHLIVQGFALYAAPNLAVTSRLQR